MDDGWAHTLLRFSFVSSGDVGVCRLILLDWTSMSSRQLVRQAVVLLCPSASEPGNDDRVVAINRVRVINA